MTTALGDKNSRRRIATHQNLHQVFGEAINKFTAKTAWSIRQRYKRKNEKQQRNQFISFRKKNVDEKISPFCDECEIKFGEYLRFLENELEEIHNFMKMADIAEGNKIKLEQQFLKFQQHARSHPQAPQSLPQSPRTNSPQPSAQSPQPHPQSLQQTTQPQPQPQPTTTTTPKQQPKVQPQLLPPHPQPQQQTKTKFQPQKQTQPQPQLSSQSQPQPQPQCLPQSLSPPLSQYQPPQPQPQPQKPELTPIYLQHLEQQWSQQLQQHKQLLQQQLQIQAQQPQTSIPTPSQSSATTSTTQQILPQLHPPQSHKPLQPTSGPTLSKDSTPGLKQPQQVKEKKKKGIKIKKGKEKGKKKKENRAKEKEVEKEKGKRKGIEKGKGIDTPVKISLKRKLEEQEINDPDLKQDLRSPKHPEHFSAPTIPLIDQSPLPNTSPPLNQISYQDTQSLQQQIPDPTHLSKLQTPQSTSKQWGHKVDEIDVNETETDNSIESDSDPVFDMEKLGQKCYENPLPLEQQPKIQELMEEHNILQQLIKECRKQKSQDQLPQLLSTIQALDLQIAEELGIIIDEYAIPYNYDDTSSIEDNLPSSEDDLPPLEDDSE